MCLLNGDLGGFLPASIDFGVEEFFNKEDNITTYRDIPIKEIIREMLHAYGQEHYHNILINDLDEAAVELLEYKGDTPIYLLNQRVLEENGIYSSIGFTNFCLNPKMECVNVATNKKITLDAIPVYDNLVEIDPDLSITPTIVKFEKANAYYSIAELKTGQAAGYRPTELTYAGELISSIGESITSILDKIKIMLGEYEYFYDLDGRFVFQRKKTYVNISWNNIQKTEDESYVENAAYSSSYSYFFGDGKLIQSFQNTPNLNNLKNDFAVWGTRETVSGVKIPIHYRYAIDKKPYEYTTIKIEEDDIKGHNALYPNAKLKIQNSKKYTAEEYDWREILYQMARDYQLYNQLDNFLFKVAAANKEVYPTGETGYEQYYIDMFSFWRELYNPEPEDEQFLPFGDKNQYWNKNVFDSPSSLNFWIDFLDADSSELGYFSTRSVGDRVKAVNDNSITSIYHREVPNLIFTTYQLYQDTEMKDWSGYTPVFVQSNLEGLFKISGQGKSAKTVVDELLYNYSYCVENISVKSIPIYYLQPNTRIYIKDDYSKINGEYIINKMTIPLSYNGTMSINATKAPERLY